MARVPPTAQVLSGAPGLPFSRGYFHSLGADAGPLRHQGPFVPPQTDSGALSSYVPASSCIPTPWVGVRTP